MHVISCLNYDMSIAKHLVRCIRGGDDFDVINGKKKCFIQVIYDLSGKQTIQREFGAFNLISGAAPKFVLSMDRLDFSWDSTWHMNIVDHLLGKKDIVLM